MQSRSSCQRLKRLACFAVCHAKKQLLPLGKQNYIHVFLKYGDLTGSKFETMMKTKITLRFREKKMVKDERNVRSKVSIMFFKTWTLFY